MLQGCSEPAFPRDPEGTLIRATGGELRVGISENPPHTKVADDGSVSGGEVDIIEAYATSIDAEIVWTAGAESSLMEQMKLGHLDLVIGGLASDSPWTTHAALSRPYAEVTRSDGKPDRLVVAVLMGENALQSNLERFFISEGLQP